MNKRILYDYGAVLEKMNKNDFIFKAGEVPQYYYYLIEGSVRVYTLSEEGKEYTHKIFGKNQGIGTPPLLIGKPYPSMAVAKTNIEYLKLGKDKFEKLLDENPKFVKGLLKGLCEVIYFKSIMSSVISLHDPAQRISTLLKQLKTQKEREEIQLTRQQIANLTALRVETVIRAIKQMEQEGQLEIKNRKVYF